MNMSATQQGFSGMQQENIMRDKRFVTKKIILVK